MKHSKLLALIESIEMTLLKLANDAVCAAIRRYLNDLFLSWFLVLSLYHFVICAQFFSHAAPVTALNDGDLSGAKIFTVPLSYVSSWLSFVYLLLDQSTASEFASKPLRNQKWERTRNFPLLTASFWWIIKSSLSGAVTRVCELNLLKKKAKLDEQKSSIKVTGKTW